MHHRKRSITEDLPRLRQFQFPALIAEQFGMVMLLQETDMLGYRRLGNIQFSEALVKFMNWQTVRNVSILKSSMTVLPFSHRR